MPDRPDPATCRHEHSEPVEVRDQVTGDVAIVARICSFCHAELSAAWGCTRCQWMQNRRLCDLVPTLVLAVPCQEHA